MYDWIDEQLHGIQIIDEDGQRLPNGKMLQVIDLARQYGYISMTADKNKNQRFLRLTVS